MALGMPCKASHMQDNALSFLPPRDICNEIHFFRLYNNKIIIL